MTARRFSPVFAALAALGLAACDLRPDAEQERLCRRLIPALVEAPEAVEVLAATADQTAHVSLRFRRAGDAADHWLICRFAGSGFSPAKRDVTGVSLDGQRLGPSALYYLTSGWLASQEAVAASPPAARQAEAPLVGAGVGYALQHALSALPKIGIYALLAASYALIYGLVGRILLSFGAFLACGGIATGLAVLLADAAGAGAFPAGAMLGLLAAVVTAGLGGFAAGRLMVVPLAARAGTAVLIASAGLALAMEEGLRLAQGARTLWLAPAFNTPVALARTETFTVTVTPMALAVAGLAGLAALGLVVFLQASRFGRMWRASADDALAAELFGIAPRRVIAGSFALAAGLAGLAGGLVTLLYGGIGFAGGAGLGLTALIAAILGGIGSVEGAMLGALVLALVEAAWSALLPIELKDAALFALLAAVLILRPAGLLAGRLPGPMRV